MSKIYLKFKYNIGTLFCSEAACLSVKVSRPSSNGEPGFERFSRVAANGVSGGSVGVRVGAFESGSQKDVWFRRTVFGFELVEDARGREHFRTTPAKRPEECFSSSAADPVSSGAVSSYRWFEVELRCFLPPSTYLPPENFLWNLFFLESSRTRVYDLWGETLVA
ncbi:hypothetical protein JTE90_029650 [Oedothorax gibbosus]|uniref:Uncharacterized protein n=1 Tax=Oedothorax gibbosus TaxID=931172 RepID=A0AAV6VHE7_9ARAC|nr:hypothetical protein JTE90_029650 [Oedothorax gibbosus]